MTTTSNFGFIDFHPILYILFYSRPSDPFLLSRESYYFEHGSVINGRHVNALLAIDKSIEKEKRSRGSNFVN